MIVSRLCVLLCDTAGDGNSSSADAVAAPQQQQQQQRQAGGSCVVSIFDLDSSYRFEYLGCTQRMVVTPLTDRYNIECAFSCKEHA
jgi:hypothetical protein